jgi:hypothetical protein
MITVQPLRVVPFKVEPRSTVSQFVGNRWLSSRFNSDKNWLLHRLLLMPGDDLAECNTVFLEWQPVGGGWMVMPDSQIWPISCDGEDELPELRVDGGPYICDDDMCLFARESATSILSRESVNDILAVVMIMTSLVTLECVDGRPRLPSSNDSAIDSTWLR